MLRLALGLSGIAATLALSRSFEQLDLLRFPLCWWALLLALSGAVRLRHGPGRSPFRSARSLVACVAGSVLFWDLFELLNLRLRNWWYVGVPESPWAGALFSALSFATVLPAVRLGVAALTPRDDPRPGLHESPLAGPGPPQRAGPTPLTLALLGLAALLLALRFPAFAFPFAWLFLWPLCEAALALVPRPAEALPSPLEALRAHAPALPLRLLAVALPLGLAWESLNWKCERGWVYTVPFFERWKLFEMPLPGYLGYLPFLLEAGAALALIERLLPRLAGARGALALCAVAVLHLGADRLGHQGTVLSNTPLLAQAHLRDAEALAQAGVRTPRDLLAQPQLDPALRGLAGLAQVAGLGVPWAEKLQRSGIASPRELALADAADLQRRLRPRAEPPPLPVLRLWIEAARRSDSR